MNVQEKLFRIWNVVKHQSEFWDKSLAENKDKEFDPMVYYYTAYYAGAAAISKIYINLWNGDITETEINHALMMLDNPYNEKKVN